MRKVLVIGFILFSLVCYAQIPRLISYQGKLLLNGQTAPDSTYTVTFSLYDDPDMGTILWTETHTVTTKNGIFSVLLGETTPFPTTLDFSESYWLGITVAGSPEMRPRYRLTTSPYAFRADIANAVDWTDITSMPPGFADGVDNIGNDSLDDLSDNSIADLSDVAVPATIPPGKVLKWNGTNWYPADDIAGGGIDTIIATAGLSAGGTGTGTIVIGIAPSGVTEDRIANSAITTPKIADNAVTTSKIADNAVTEDKIATASVTSSKIANNAITTGKIANGAVTLAKLSTYGGAGGQVPKIVGGSVVWSDDDIGLTTVTTDGSLTGNGTRSGPLAIADDFPFATVGEIAGPSFEVTRANNFLTFAEGFGVRIDVAPTSHIVTISMVGTTGVANIDAGDGLSGTDLAGPHAHLAVNVDNATIEIVNDTLRVRNDGIGEAQISRGVRLSHFRNDLHFLSKDSIGDGLTFVGGRLSVDFGGVGVATTVSRSDHTHTLQLDGAVTGVGVVSGIITTDLANNVVNTDNIVDSAVTTDKLADGAVTTEKIADGAITIDKMANCSVGNMQLCDYIVTTNKLSNNAVTAEKIDAGPYTHGECLKVDSLGNLYWDTDEIGLTGTGVTNHLAKWDSGNLGWSIVQEDSSIIGTAVGVGDITYNNRFSVHAPYSFDVAVGVYGPRGIFSYAYSSDDSVYSIEGRLSSLTRSLIGYRKDSMLYGIYGIGETYGGFFVNGRRTSSFGFMGGVFGNDTVGGYAQYDSNKYVVLGNKMITVYAVNNFDSSDAAGGKFVLKSTADGCGVIGVADSVEGSGNGGCFRGGHMGVKGFADLTGTSGVNHIGVYGYAANGTGFNYGVYGYSSGGAGGAGVYYSGGLAGSGTKSAVVRTSDGRPVRVYCQESPENWFEDFGSGKIINGHARINLPDDFRDIVTINETYPMKVFITATTPVNGSFSIKKDEKGFDVYFTPQPVVVSGMVRLKDGAARVEFPDWFRKIASDKVPNVTATPVADCNGVFVENIDSRGFKIKELSSGKSDALISWVAVIAPDMPKEIEFDWRVVAKRKGFEQLRLEEFKAAYMDPYLFPDIDDVPMQYRAEWIMLHPKSEWKREWFDKLDENQLKKISRWQGGLGK